MKAKVTVTLDLGVAKHTWTLEDADFVFEYDVNELPDGSATLGERATITAYGCVRPTDEPTPFPEGETSHPTGRATGPS